MQVAVTPWFATIQRFASKSRRCDTEAKESALHGISAPRGPYPRVVAGWVRFTGAIALALTIAATAWALDPNIGYLSQYATEVWTRRQGMPTNTVTAIAQTTDGYLWVGTPAGVVRFDGIRFTAMPLGANAGAPPFINCLAADSDGGLWVGTKASGIWRVARGVAESIPAFQHASNVRGILTSPDHTVVVGTDDGLFQLEGRDTARTLAKSTSVTPLRRDGNNGRVWSFTSEYVQLWSPDGQAGRDIFVPGYIEAMRVSRDGRILIGTYNGLFEQRNETVESLAAVDPQLGIHVKAILDDRDGNVWLATTEGVTRVQFLADGHVRLSRYPIAGGALCLAEDREGSLWIGCVDGLRRLKNARAVVWGAPEGIAGNFMPAVTTTPTGEVLIFGAGTEPAITGIRHGETVRVATIPDGPSCFGADGSLWVVTYDLLYRVRDGTATKFTAAEGVPTAWKSTVLELAPGELLFTVDKIGPRLWRDGKNDPFLLRDGTPFTSTFFVMAAHRDPAGVIWMGTYDGLWRLKDGEVTRYTTAAGFEANRTWYDEHPQSAACFKTVVADGLPDYWVSALDDDRHGALWASSNRGGLARLRDGQFTGFTTRDGLPTDEIFSVVVDDDGNVWLGTAIGIFELLASDLAQHAARPGEKLRPIGFSSADGLRSEECLHVYMPAATRSPDGRVWFATREGVVSIDPRQHQRNASAPPVHIEEILLDGVPAAVGQRVAVPAGYTRLEIHFTALSLATPERARLKYRLQGYNTGWVTAGRDRTAHYSRLRPGTYRFEVIAANEDGVWNDQGAAVTLELAPFFYQTTWFGLTAIGLVLAAILGAHRWHVRHLHRRKAELADRVRERTAELSEANVALKKEMAERERAEADAAAANRELVIAAHRAGMAEVAEDVLHNVGNALNSVNVSVGLVGQLARKDGISKLARAAELVGAHEQCLEEFFGPHGKGTHLPKFLRALAAQMAEERTAMTTEITALQTHVVGMISLVEEQKRLAGATGAVEDLELRDVVRQAVNLLHPTFAREEIAVQLTLPDDVWHLRAERYKLLEIVTNLLDHAGQSVLRSGAARRIIAVAVAGGPATVSLRISASGAVGDGGSSVNPFAQAEDQGSPAARYRMHITAILVKKLGGKITTGAGATGENWVEVEFPGEPGKCPVKRARAEAGAGAT